jgi:hypothetical protein
MEIVVENLETREVHGFAERQPTKLRVWGG